MSEEEKNEEVEVTIRRDLVRRPMADGGIEQVYLITYFVPGMAPGLLELSKEEYTTEKELELIKQSIEDRKATPPSVVKL